MQARIWFLLLNFLVKWNFLQIVYIVWGEGLQSSVLNCRFAEFVNGSRFHKFIWNVKINRNVTLVKLGRSWNTLCRKHKNTLFSLVIIVHHCHVRVVRVVASHPKLKWKWIFTHQQKHKNCTHKLNINTRLLAPAPLRSVVLFARSIRFVFNS